MAGRGIALTRPAWMKHAEEAKVKDEEEKAAAARAAFEATFRDVEGQAGGAPPMELDSDSEGEDVDRLANKPIGPVDPGKCTAAGTGVGGGAAGAAASFVVVTKDSDGRRIPHGGAYIRVRVTPGAGVGGVEQDAVVKDHADGTYTATYAVAKRGDYMVSVECNGHPICGSPFPVFFSGGNVPMGVGLIPTSTPMMGASPFLGVGQPMNMSPFSMPGMFSGMLGMISGVMIGASGGAVLPGLGAAFGEVCRDYLNGRCARPDCKYNHPPQNQLMAALAAGGTMGGLSQMPMAPSAAAMAAAQSIAAANAFQAAQAAQQQQQQQAGLDDGDGKEEEEDNHEPICTVHVTNINPILTADQLQQLFNYCGTVVDCSMSDSKTSAYVEYSKPEGAKAGLALNDMPVGGQKLKVELKRKPRAGKHGAGNGSSMNGMGPPQLPIMMQQAVVMQQMQFQQALYMQHAMASQQAAARAATVKSAAEMASARAAEISKHLAGPNDGTEAAGAVETGKASPRARSKSKSPSSRFRRDRRSRSGTPARLRRRRSRSRSRDRSYFQSRERGSYYRGGRDPNPWRLSRRDRDREIELERREHYNSRSSRRGRSRSRDRVRRRSRSRSGSRSRSRRDRTPSPRRHRTYESDHRGSGRGARRTRSRSKETRKSRSRSRSVSPGRGRYSPKKEDVKEIRSKSAVKEGTQSPKRKGGSGATERERSGKVDQLHSDSAAKNVSLENGILVNKSVVVDEVVMEVKSTLSTKLDTATILKDLEDKRRQQLEDSSNVVAGDVPSSEAGEGAEMKGFKKPVKKGSKEKTSTADDGSEEEETEVMDDWRDDIKSQGRKKPKSKDKKEKLVSKTSKDEERLVVSPDAALETRKEVQNGKDHDRGGWTEVRKETVKEVVGQGQANELKLSEQPVNGANHRSRRVTENVAIATSELITEVKNIATERYVVAETLTSTEAKVGHEAEVDDISVVEDVKPTKEVEETIITVSMGKDQASVDEVADHERKVGEASGSENDDDGRVVGVLPPDEDELVMEVTTQAVDEEEKPRDRRSRKKSEEDVSGKRRRKKSREAGDDGEERERRRERHRRHHKKHRNEEVVEKGEDEDEEKEDAEQRKERRRHKSRKHKKDDVEKREKKRRKHRTHRRKRSPSESPEASPSGGGDKVKDDEDTTTKREKSHRSRRSSERSPSVEAGVESPDEGVTRKKSSSSRSHKKKRREPSKSASESPSSSE